VRAAAAVSPGNAAGCAGPAGHGHADVDSHQYPVIKSNGDARTHEHVHVDRDPQPNRDTDADVQPFGDPDRDGQSHADPDV
jgi:hypothetical protein